MLNNSLSSWLMDDSFFNETFYGGLITSTSLATNSSANPGTGSDLYEVPTELIILLSFFYGTISFLAVVGNAIVMWIVGTSRRMQNVTNYFIANLALADIVIGLFSIPFQFQAALLQRWNLPYFMCSFCPFIQVLSVNVSVFTLTAIAVDRHRAILYPLSARPSKRIAKFIIAAIWVISLIFSVPMAIALRVEMWPEIHPITGEKYVKPFCTPSNISEKGLIIYRMILCLLQYFTPLCVISFVYARMALRLWGSKAPGNAQDSRDANIMKNKKKVIKMLVIVVALFGICWLPLQSYQVLHTWFPSINEYRYINIVFFCCDWLAMSNSCYNPFIYGIYNEKFQREFKQRFSCCRKSKHNAPMESYEMDKTMNSIAHTRLSSIKSTSVWRRSTRLNNTRMSLTIPHNNLRVNQTSARFGDGCQQMYNSRKQCYYTDDNLCLNDEQIPRRSARNSLDMNNQECKSFLRDLSDGQESV